MCVELLPIGQGFKMGFDGKSNRGRGCIRIVLRFIHGAVPAVGAQGEDVKAKTSNKVG